MTRTSIPLRFPNGIPGFDGICGGELVRGTGPIMALRVGSRTLPVVVPWDVDPEFGYRFLDTYTEGMGDPADWTIVCVVNLPKRNRRGTINLFAPIVVNERLGIAAQIVNSASGYSTRDPFEVTA